MEDLTVTPDSKFSIPFARASASGIGWTSTGMAEFKAWFAAETAVHAVRSPAEIRKALAAQAVVSLCAYRAAHD